MRVCGIIAEYNPFHSGHAYQIAEARARSGCDYLIAVMSGDFVQRGAPALMDKYIRARMALASGADLVLMLPVAASTASAEGFARAGISVLHTTSVVDTISFGCEDPAVCGEPYRELARRLSDESSAFQAALQRGLSSGLPYAQARTAAIHSCADGCDPVLLNDPNNLLAFEYMRAIAYTHADLELCPIQRSAAITAMLWQAVRMITIPARQSSCGNLCQPAPAAACSQTIQKQRFTYCVSRNSYLRAALTCCINILTPMHFYPSRICPHRCIMLCLRKGTTDTPRISTAAVISLHASGNYRAHTRIFPVFAIC